jgi:polyisoprenoid-binding protein YceI
MIRALEMCVLLIFGTGLMAAPLQEEQSRYVVKTSSKIEFHATSTFAKVVGVFHSWDADMKVPAGKFADASLVLEIEAASVTTGSGTRASENSVCFEEHYRGRRSHEISHGRSTDDPGNHPAGSGFHYAATAGRRA